jgi:antitoxin CcdA
MLTRPTPSADRTAIDIQMRTDLLEEAKELGIDVESACEHGLKEEVAKIKADRWYQENREAVDYWNRYVEEHGLPLARYRQF